jgi:chaperonin GroES
VFVSDLAAGRPGPDVAPEFTFIRDASLTCASAAPISAPSVGTLFKRLLTDAHRGRRRRIPHQNSIQEEDRTMKFRPLHDRVVVRRLDGEEKTKGGIIIPDTAKEKPQEGEVVSVGPGARDDAGKLVALDVKKGDRVLFGKWSGTEVKIDGQDLLIMKESDIMGVIG